MKTRELFRELEQILEVSPESIRGDQRLDDLAGWNSLAAIAFLAMADEKAGASVDAARLSKCRTVADLIDLLPVQSINP